MQSVCARVYLWEKSPKSEKCIFSTERLSTRWIIFLKLSCPCSQALPLMCCGARFTDRWCSYFEKQYYKLFTLPEECEDLDEHMQARPLPVPERV